MVLNNVHTTNIYCWVSLMQQEITSCNKDRTEWIDPHVRKGYNYVNNSTTTIISFSQNIKSYWCQFISLGCGFFFTLVMV